MEMGTRSFRPDSLRGNESKSFKTSNTLIIEGKNLSDFPAFLIADYNWIKLRDLADLLKNTPKKFDVLWNKERNAVEMTAGKPYVPDGTEQKKIEVIETTAIASLQKFIIDGKEIELAAYNIGGYNYIRVRDLAILLDFNVIFEKRNGGTVTFDFENGYIE